MARSRPPSFDFYPEDFLAGTMHLHPVCIGIYIRLLCFQWSHGAIPTDQRQLMQVTGAMPSELEEYLSQVLSKFDKCEDGALRNARLERERARKTAVSQQRANAAGARWSSRPSESEPSSGVANASANASANGDAKHMLPKGKSEVGSGKKEAGSSGARKKDAGAWEVPSELDTPRVRELLLEFQEMRRSIGKPIRNLKNTSRVLKDFRNVEHLEFALNKCITREWVGLDAKYDPLTEASGARPVQQTFEQMKNQNTLDAGDSWLRKKQAEMEAQGAIE